MLIGDKTKSNAHFDFRIYNCRCDFTDDFWKIALPITVFTFSLAPNLIIILTTVPTLKYLMTVRKSARRSQGRVPWQGALTVVLTAFMNTISTLPTALFLILQKFIKGQQDPSNWFHVKFLRICTILMMINIMANFYIYCLTISSFRRFLLSRIQLVVSVIPRSSRNTADPHVVGNALYFEFSQLGCLQHIIIMSICDN